MEIPTLAQLEGPLRKSKDTYDDAMRAIVSEPAEAAALKDLEAVPERRPSVQQETSDFELCYEHAAEAREVAAAAGAEVAAAAAAAVAATAELQEERNKPKQVVELKIVVAEPSPPAAEVPAEVRSPAAAGDCDSEAGCDSEACKVCGVADERDALLCDGCDGAFHMGCLKPPRKRVPAGDWFCKPCAAERKPAPKRRAAAPAAGARRSARARS